MSGWGMAIWRFLTQKEKFLRLYVERKELFNSLSELG
jgi:hypothetical protein